MVARADGQDKQCYLCLKQGVSVPRFSSLSVALMGSCTSTTVWLGVVG